MDKFTLSSLLCEEREREREKEREREREKEREREREREEEEDIQTYLDLDQGVLRAMLVDRLTLSSLLCTNFRRFHARSLCLNIK